jgi:hypothetical protein
MMPAAMSCIVSDTFLRVCLQASKWDGVTNYHVKVVETEEEQQARLEAYARELEGGN